jgi:hypothetical protein
MNPDGLRQRRTLIIIQLALIAAIIHHDRACALS